VLCIFNVDVIGSVRGVFQFSFSVLLWVESGEAQASN